MTLAKAEEVASDKALVNAMSSQINDEESYLNRHNAVFTLVTQWKDEFTRRGVNHNHQSGRLADSESKETILLQCCGYPRPSRG